MVSYRAIIQALKEAGETDPALRDSVGLYVDLLELQAGVDAGPSTCQVSASEAQERLGLGQPLLASGAWTVEGEIVAALCVHVAQTTARHRRDLAQPLGQIAAWSAAHGDAVAGAVFDYLNGSYCQEALEAGLDAELYHFVLAHALRPFLRAEAEGLMPLIDLSRWFRGACPVCGGKPDMAALEREGGGRRLMCSRCDAEWPFYRTVCPFCGDDSHIGYYAAKPGYRLYACDTCRQYIKTVDWRDMALTRPLPAERIVTIDMDIAARAAGWGVRAASQQG